MILLNSIIISNNNSNLHSQILHWISHKINTILVAVILIIDIKINLIIDQRECLKWIIYLSNVNIYIYIIYVLYMVK